MHRGKVIAASVAAAIVLLLLVWGSGSGTTVLHSPSGQAGSVQADGQTETVMVTFGDQAAVSQEPPEKGGTNHLAALDWLMLFFALVVLAIVVKVVQWLLNRDWEEAEPSEDDDEPDDLGLLLRATSEATRSQALAEGEPRNVVVRCWVALEDAAAGSGLARDPAETSAEFTHRFLGAWDVDAQTTRELAGLYREARFSRHPVALSAGERAVALVGSIHDQIRQASRASSPTATAPQDEAGPQ